MNDLIQEFKSESLVKPKISAVYGIYTLSGECLWIGETENLYSRLDDHYHSSRGITIRGCIEKDDNSDISTEDLWEKTALKTTIINNTERRKRLERQLIEELEPRYNKQYGTSSQKWSTTNNTQLDGGQSTTKDKSRYNIPVTFNKFVLNWDWPEPLTQKTKQAQNVVGVIYRLMAMDGFSTDDFIISLQNRADEARGADRSLGEDYEETVRANCVRDLGYTKENKERETAAKDFLAEARNLVQEYKEKYR